MDENVVPGFAGKNLKIKSIARSGPLSVINGDINNRKRSINTARCRPYLTTKHTFSVYEDEVDENRDPGVNAVASPSGIILNKEIENNKDQGVNAFARPSGIFLNKEIENNKDQGENAFARPSGIFLNKEIENNKDQGENAFTNLSGNSSSGSSTTSPDFIGLSPVAQTEALCFFYNRQKQQKCSSELTSYIPYQQDIYRYFVQVERKFRPDEEYMLKQCDLNMGMRRILVDWMIEVGIEYKLKPETLHYAVSYVDRFLSNVAVFRKKLQLLGTTTLFIAAKYEEVYPPEISEFVLVTDNTYTKRQVLRMEHLILKVLDYGLSGPTAYTYSQLFCSMCNASAVILNYSQYICDLTLVDGALLLRFGPRLIGAGSVALSNFILGKKAWEENMEKLTMISLDSIYMVIVRIFDLLHIAPSHPQQAVFEKFKSPKFGSVSAIKIPKHLDVILKKKTKKLETAAGYAENSAGGSAEASAIGFVERGDI